MLEADLAQGEHQYVFLDFAKGNTPRETKIPIRKTDGGEACIEDEDVRDFLKKDLGRKDLLIVCPVWRLEWQ